MDEADAVAATKELWVQADLPGGDDLELFASILRVHAQMVERCEAVLKTFDLGLTRQLCLMTLLVSKEYSRRLSSLGRSMLVHPTTVTIVVDQLGRAGLVKRAPHPSDRRVTLAVLTPAGRRLATRSSLALAKAAFGLPELDLQTSRQLVSILTELRKRGGDIGQAPSITPGGTRRRATAKLGSEAR